MHLFWHTGFVVLRNWDGGFKRNGRINSLFHRNVIQTCQNCIVMMKLLNIWHSSFEVLQNSFPSLIPLFRCLKSHTIFPTCGKLFQLANMGLFLESVTCVDLAITYHNKSNIVASIGSIWNDLAAEVSQP